MLGSSGFLERACFECEHGLRQSCVANMMHVTRRVAAGMRQ